MVVYSHNLFELNYKVRLKKLREAFHLLYFVKVYYSYVFKKPQHQ